MSRGRHLDRYRYRSFNLVLLSLLAIGIFAPLWNVRFTTADDMFIDVSWTIEGIRVGRYSAENQGRFFQLYTTPIATLPHWTDSATWLFTWRLLGFVTVLATINWAARRILGGPQIANLAVLFSLVFLQNGWDHNLFTSYPLIFNLYAASFFASLALFDLAIERHRVSIAGLSAILYFFSLSTELFVLFAPVFLWLIFRKNGSNETFPQHSLFNRLRLLVPLLVSLLIYLVTYWVFRRHAVSIGKASYDGNLLNGSSVGDMLAVIWHYSINGFPVQSIFSMPEYLRYLSSRGSLTQLLVFGQSVTAALLVGRILSRDIPSRCLSKHRKDGLFALIVAIFLVNVLVGASAKYQDWVRLGSRSFTYTQYSSYFAALLTATVLVKIIASLSSRQKLKRFKNLNVLVILVTFVSSVAVSARNTYFTDDQIRSNHKWQLVDKWVSSPSFEEIPTKSYIYSPTLIAHQRGIAQALGPYWSNYVYAKSGKKLDFGSEACEVSRRCYFLSFQQSLTTSDQHLLFGNVTDKIRLTTSEVFIFSLPATNATDDQRLFYEPSDSLGSTRGEPVTSEGVRDVNAFSSGLYESLISRNIARVSTNKPMSIDGLEVRKPTPLDSMNRLNLGEGFYREEANNGSKWNWAVNQATLTISNPSRKPFRLVGEINTIHPRDDVWFLFGNSVVGTISAYSTSWTNFKVGVPCAIDECRLEIVSRLSSIRPNSTDSRLLSFRLSNLKVIVDTQ